MIKSFADRRTLAAFRGKVAKGIGAGLARAAQRKLALLHDALNLDELRQPPGNRLEKLAGDRAGQWSIRVNDQWRICFRWDGQHAFEVELVDYH
jgi:proteic killer suppression protein